MEFDIKSEKLLAQIEEEMAGLRAAYGRRLREHSTNNIYVQHALGQMEAYMRVRIMIRNLTCPEFDLRRGHNESSAT
jgi:hypothetical protein